MESNILVLVDDNIANLKAGKSALPKYDVITVPSAAKLFEVLERCIPNLILLDVDMPDMDGYETIKILKGNAKTAEIPVIFLTGKVDIANELEGLLLGAVDYITKPFLPELLNKRVEVHLTIQSQRRQLQKCGEDLRNFNERLQEMVDEKTEDMKDLQNALLQTISDLVERRDCDTGGHIARTQRYLQILIAALMKQPKYREFIEENWDVGLLILSSQLHDVGKIAIPDNILLKRARLTEEEFNEMKKHVTYGEEIIAHVMEICENNTFLRYANTFVKTHHEKWDGSGYPRGLKGEYIPLSGRLMAIVDVYDALVSQRPYKEPFTHEAAVEIMINSKGTHFDPALIDIFVKIADKFKAVKEEV
ncbi:two-component system response regulator [Synergistales bacterium]|nr:two-component system response regulator [Synergistales bacterium]